MSIVDDVGELAGRVWHFLDEHGRCSLTAVESGIEAPRALVVMAIGWLAREGKVELLQEGRATLVCLRGD